MEVSFNGVDSTGCSTYNKILNKKSGRWRTKLMVSWFYGSKVVLKSQQVHHFLRRTCAKGPFTVVHIRSGLPSVCYRGDDKTNGIPVG